VKEPTKSTGGSLNCVSCSFTNSLDIRNRRRAAAPASAGRNERRQHDENDPGDQEQISRGDATIGNVRYARAA
jgi:hypothetical protein